MKNTKLSAFTLIELLIVITIIAVLASIALPAFTGVKERADQTKDLSNAKQIALALRQFAIDNNGSYPAKAPAADYSDAPATPPNTSNDAFWWLIPTYLQSEGIFAISGSAYTPANPDNRLDAVGAGDADRYAQTRRKHIRLCLWTNRHLESDLPADRGRFCHGFARHIHDE